MKDAKIYQEKIDDINGRDYDEEPLWGPFLCIYKGLCNFGASFGAPQIE